MTFEEWWNKAIPAERGVEYAWEAGAKAERERLAEKHAAEVGELREALETCFSALDGLLGDSDLPDDDRPGVIAMQRARAALARRGPEAGKCPVCKGAALAPDVLWVLCTHCDGKGNVTQAEGAARRGPDRDAAEGEVGHG